VVITSYSMTILPCALINMKLLPVALKGHFVVITLIEQSVSKLNVIHHNHQPMRMMHVFYNSVLFFH